MKILLKILLITSALLIGYIIYSQDLCCNKRTKPDNIVENNIEKGNQVSPDEVSCSDEELQISALDEGVLKSTNAMKLIRENCYIVLGEEFYDVTGDGVEDIILNLGNLGCVSCHPRTIIVIDGSEDEILLDKFYDAVTGSARVRNLDRGGFEIVHSFEWSSTPNEISKATELVSVYSFNKESGNFEEVESYREPQSYYDFSE